MMKLLHKNFVRSLLLYAFLLTGIVSWGQVISENFSSITSGNNTTTGGSGTTWSGNTNFPTVTAAYQAGGAVKLGTGSASGSITSKSVNLSSGSFTVTFDVKGWTTVEGSIKVTITGGTTQTQTVSYTAVMDGSFETKTVNFNAGAASSTVKIETTAKRAYIDNVVVQFASSAPVISSGLTDSSAYGATDTYQITASNTPTSFNATGLPAGATVNTTSGLISFATTVAAGTYNISITATNASGFDTKTLVYTRNKAAQSISNFTSNISKTYGDAPFSPGATATSGLAVSYSSSNTAVATVSGTTVTIVGAGTSTITATQAGDSNYNAATQVQRTLTVGKASQTITFDPLSSKTYGDAAFTLGATASSGLAVSYTSSNTSVATVSGSTISIVSPGSATITASQSGGTNYNAATPAPQTLVVNARQLTVTGAAAADKVYNASSDAIITGATLAGGVVGSDEVYLAPAYSALFSDPGAGTNKTVTATFALAGAQAARYSLTQPAGLSATITAKDITIGGISVNSKPYDGNAVATLSGTPALTGVESADEADVTLTGTPVASFDSAEIGTHNVTITGYSLSGSASGNYNLLQPQGLTGTITNPALNDQSINFAPIDAISYGDAFTLNASATSGLAVSYTSSDEAIATISGNVLTALNVGTVTITAYQAGGNGYNPASPVAQELTITPRQLTVVGAAAATKVYDGTTAATFGGTLAGVINDDTVTVSGVGSFTSAGAGTAVPATASYSLGGADAYKYTLVQPVGITGNITPAALTLQGAMAQDKVYDGTTPAIITGTLNGIIGDDAVAFTGNGAFEAAGAGTDVPVSAALTLTGADAENYTIVQPAGLIADITPASLTISGISGENKTYDGNTAASVAGIPVLNGIVGSDDVSLSGMPSATFATKNAASGIALTVSGYTLAGSDAGNYILTQPQGLLATITKKTITADLSSASAEKTYDGTTAATVTGAVLNGIVSGDVVTVSGTYASPNAASGISVSLTLGGADKDNYTLEEITGFAGAINKKALTAKADDKTVNKNAAMPQFTITYTGFVSGENASALAQLPTASTTVNNTSVPGAYPVSLSGGSAANYTFSLQSGWLIINDFGDTVVVDNTTIWSNDINDSNPSSANPYTSGQTFLSDYITVSGIGRGTGLTANSGSNRYNTKDFNTSSIDLTQYFTFTLTPLTGNKIDISSFVYTGQLSSGTLQMALRSSADGFTANIGSPTSGGTTIDLSSLGNLTAATEFRLYIWGGAANSTTYSINSFYFTGAIIGQGATPGTAPTITSNTTYSSTFGTPGTYTITASGSPVITGYNAVGTNSGNTTTTALPQGVTVETSSGMVSFDGTTPVGTYYIRVSATNYYGTGSRLVTYTVTAAPTLAATPSAITLQAYQGQPASNTQAQLTAVTGSNLTSATNGPIQVTASAGFLVSVNASAFSSSNTIYYSGTSLNLASPQIFVKLANDLAVGSYTGTLTLNGGGATTTIALSGTVETAPAIYTAEASYGPYCQGNTAATINVGFSSEGTFPSGSFFVQYSNPEGIFPAGLTNTLYSSQGSSSPLTATLPANLAPGSYLVRVIHLTDGESPVRTVSSDSNGAGADNGNAIYVNAVPTLTGITAPPVCSGQGTTVSLSGLLPDAAMNYYHVVNYTINGISQPAAATAAGGTTFEVPAGFANDQTLAVTSIARVKVGDTTQSCATALNLQIQMQVLPVPTLGAATAMPVCNGASTEVLLTGLLSNSSFTISYTINGGAAAQAVVTSGASGEGSFTLVLNPGTYTIEIINIATTGATPSCEAALAGITTQVVVNSRPAASIASGNVSVCLGDSAGIQITLSGTAPWQLSYNNGAGVTTKTILQSEVSSNTYILEVVPAEGSGTYTITDLTDANCTALPTDLNGAVTITAAPNTFTQAVSSDWFNAANWSCGVIPDDNIVAKISQGIAVVNGQGASAKSLDINSGAKVLVKSGNALSVADKLTANGELELENNAHLIQDAAATLNTNEGTGVTVHRNSSLLYRQDYTLWSSPVASQGLAAFSPETLAERFYTYNTSNNTYTSVGNSGIFQTGTGYLVRMPNAAYLSGSGNTIPSGTFSTTAAEYQTGASPMTFNAKFSGRPNNGSIQVNVSSATDGFNAIGNPYPSPVSIAAFFAANPNLDGVLYFWRKKNSAAVTSAYCTVNAEGWYSGNGQDGASDPQGIIQTGQGFIVKANSGNTVTFNNGMRAANGNDSSFFRMSAALQTPAASHKLWLNLANSGGIVSQALIGYSANATTGVDTRIDAPYINDSQTALTSLISDKAYTIQGRPLPFVVTDEVPLHFKTATAGNFSIALDHFDGLFSGQDIFLKDNTTGSIHNLKAGSYTFSSSAGAFASRFAIVYQNTALGADSPDLSDAGVFVYNSEGAIAITANGNIIKNVTVFDTRGRLLLESMNINASETKLTNLVAESQMLIVKVTLANGAAASRKIAY